MKRVLFTLLIYTFCIFLNAQTIIINEIMASNSTTINDLDGDYPDWIELYNPTGSSVNLLDYGLSDDPDEPHKWRFPDIEVPPYGYLLVFASDKDITAYGGHWETVIDWGDSWKYRIYEFQPPRSWRNNSFDDSAWSTGASGFGYGDGDDATILPTTTNVYIRGRFNIQDIDFIKKALLHIDYDDAFVAYMNGAEFARSNIGTPGVTPANYQESLEIVEAQIYQGGTPEAYDIDLSHFRNGTNVIAIEIHNHTEEDSDLTAIPFVTLFSEEPPEGAHGPADLLLPLQYRRLHTNFKISGEGETLCLSDPEGVTVDCVTTGAIPSDVSIGRHPDGGDQWLFYDAPTPETANGTGGYQGIAESPVFSCAGGFFDSPRTISLATSSEASIIRFTLDGSDPTEESLLYSQPFNVSETTVIKARAFETAKLPSCTQCNTYFINVDHDLAVVSLSTDPDNFFDYERGIYVEGPNADSEFPYLGANYWNDWEKPIYIEMFDENRQLLFKAPMGVKITGNYSRTYPQKSLAFYARGCYGCSEVECSLFPEKEIDSFETFILRSSGHDWRSTMFRDAMITGLVADEGIERQAYRPTVVYLNGEYWGIHNLREKINEHFIASNCGADPDHIDLLEKGGAIIEGDNRHYNNLKDYISGYDLSVAENYDFVCDRMDIDNFINYQAIEIYCNNQDWPCNNIKYWRPRTPDGKWRWILYDTDYGFGLYGIDEYTFNTLEYATDADGQGWPDQPWVTIFIRKLMENESFRIDFINRFCDLMNTCLKPEIMVDQINAKAAVIQSEIPAHNNRWNQIANWQANVDNMITFAQERDLHMKVHLRDHFGLGDMRTLTVDVSPGESGNVRVNTALPDDYPWGGAYFPDIPIGLTAIPEPGNRFNGWQGTQEDSAQITIILADNQEYTAIFEREGPDNTAICLNEINYNSADGFDPDDWVELINSDDLPNDISGWAFKDEEDDHVFIIPDGTVLDAGAYLVLCTDSEKFCACFPEVANYIGDFDFGLSGGGELIRLYDADDNLIDSVEYDDGGDWPSPPDGDGPTLELINTDYDNGLAESWAASTEYGTPGKRNSCLSGVDPNGVVPLRYTLSNYPNPFNPVTTVLFSMPEEGEVELCVFNIKGQKVATLVKSRLAAGEHRVKWQGQDSNGNSVSSGIYFYRLRVDDKNKAVHKGLLLK